MVLVVCSVWWWCVLYGVGGVYCMLVVVCNEWWWWCVLYGGGVVYCMVVVLCNVWWWVCVLYGDGGVLCMMLVMCSVWWWWCVLYGGMEECTRPDSGCTILVMHSLAMCLYGFFSTVLCGQNIIFGLLVITADTVSLISRTATFYLLNNTQLLG